MDPQGPDQGTREESLLFVKQESAEPDNGKYCQHYGCAALLKILKANKKNPESHYQKDQQSLYSQYDTSGVKSAEHQSGGNNDARAAEGEETSESTFGDDDNFEEEDQAFKWQATQIWYSSLKIPSLEAAIRFEKARQQDRMRTTKIERKKRFAEEVLYEKEMQNLDRLLETSESDAQEVLYDDQSPEKVPESQSPKPNPVPMPTPKQAKKAQISKKEINRASKIGFQHLREKQAEKWSTKKSKKTQQKTTRLSNADIDNLFYHDLVASAKANASMSELPKSENKDKSKALAEIIAALPIDDQREAKSDRAKCIEASKKFTPSAKFIDQAWKIKGLATGLYHYQLISTAWMRDRENSDTEPNGGLLCDEMGLGKTLTAIEGRSAEEGPTLIVVPRNLVTHWLDQLEKHCEKNTVTPIAYHAGARPRISGNLGAWLQKQDVVVTTYYEINASYPAMKPPENAAEYEALEEWWKSFYAEHLGVFHATRWHRIILDEAHAIKNLDAKTSIAVRALSAKHKWVLSGTPLHNCIEEFYPYFEFIGVPSSSPFETFQKNYCNRQPVSRERLIAMLRLVLHRKTHDSRMFKLPLIHLPGISENEVYLDHNPAEAYLYERMHQFFLEMINGLVRDRGKQFKCFLTMVLKLRMFTSHLLVVQDIVKRIINQPGVIENMKHLVKGQGDSDSAKITKFLIAMKSNAPLLWAPALPRVESSFDRPRPPASSQNLQEVLRAKLEILHGRGNWNERLERTECPRCRSPPVESFVLTPCLHLYCEQCFDELPDENGKTDTVARLCCICRAPINEAGFYEDINDPDMSEPPEPAQYIETEFMTNTPKRKKRTSKAKAQHKRQKKNSKIEKRPLNVRLLDHKPDGDSSGNSSEDEMDQKCDWIQIIGDRMPSTKLEAIKKLVKDWVEQDPTVKIVIFTQFLSSVTLIEWLCVNNDWGYAKMTGQMSFVSRESQIKTFKEDDKTHVLISSLKAGGAYCRLYRIGQIRQVEYVKLITKSTIDELLLTTQRRKTRQISTVMSQKALTSTNTMKELLSMFGDVTETVGGGFQISAYNAEQAARFWDGIREKDKTR
ncbi:hypothetical protein PENANT_c007G01402 [Penicillium antarcticum]|uniref:Helicase ATP-binding domain-containing protein n=1 Tax=Penicillium antarcticum TaxID=416450 RepID=A0A1V6QC43_9EURO|nr:hypothetical protein PENANT_c007G01402 [Penicillium antarcticum]